MMELSMKQPKQQHSEFEFLFDLPAVANVWDFEALARRWESKRCLSFSHRYQKSMPFGHDSFVAGLGRILYAFGRNQAAIRQLQETLADMDAVGMESVELQIRLVVVSFVMFGYVKTDEDIPELIGPFLPEIKEARRMATRRSPGYGRTVFGACAYHDEMVLREIVEDFSTYHRS